MTMLVVSQSPSFPVDKPASEPLVDDRYCANYRSTMSAEHSKIITKVIVENLAQTQRTLMQSRNSEFNNNTKLAIKEEETVIETDDVKSTCKSVDDDVDSGNKNDEIEVDVDVDDDVDVDVKMDYADIRSDDEYECLPLDLSTGPRRHVEATRIDSGTDSDDSAGPPGRAYKKSLMKRYRKLIDEHFINIIVTSHYREYVAKIPKTESKFIQVIKIT